MHVSRTTVILIILALLLLAAAGYLLFGQSKGAGILASGVSPASSAELTFIGLTARIDPVEFDTSILNDPRFASLRDIRTAVTQEAAGRADPFAPLGR